MHSLYLCYFGLREPLVQTQVLPYLRELQKDGHRISLLTFEPNMRAVWPAAELDRQCRELENEGTTWLALPYHKRPTAPATFYDVVRGAWRAARFARREKVDVFHARNHVAALMAMWAQKFVAAKLIFDIRGFFPEEYVDAGHWPADGKLFRSAKRTEKKLLANADGFVVLTERARSLLFDQAETRPVEVIPCCVDLERFQPPTATQRETLRTEFGFTGRRVIVYLGALGGWYLSDEMADFFATAHRQDPNTISLILTQSDQDEFAEKLRARGVADDDFLILRADPVDVPRYLSAADLAVMFIKPSYSKQASSPTKLAEYLACGLPVMCNAGIGDVDDVIEGDGVGVVIREMNAESYTAALTVADELCLGAGIRERCRASAERRFDLIHVGGEKYRNLYRVLTTKKHE